MKGNTMKADACFYSFPVRFFLKRICKGALERSGFPLSSVSGQISEIVLLQHLNDKEKALYAVLFRYNFPRPLNTKWAEQGSNLRPHLCKRCALTN